MQNHQMAHFAPNRCHTPPPLKRTPIAYRACGLHNGPETWFTSGWRIYFPSLCFSGHCRICCLEWNAEGRLIVPLLAGQKRRA